MRMTSGTFDGMLFPSNPKHSGNLFSALDQCSRNLNVLCGISPLATKIKNKTNKRKICSGYFYDPQHHDTPPVVRSWQTGPIF